jgi:hypothetical protein
VQHALKTALNMSADLGSFLHRQAMLTNPDGETWGLDTLSIHDILEHDASLSRADDWLTGDGISFNATVFEQTNQWWTGDLIDIQQAANARLGRILDSAKYNPRFTMSERASQFAAGEGAAYLIIFGDRSNYTARKDLVTYLFGESKHLINETLLDMCGLLTEMTENERLPTELGWTTPNPEFNEEELFSTFDKIYEATKYDPEIFP